MKIKPSRLRVILFFVFIAVIGISAYFFMPKILEIAGFILSLFLPFILGYAFSRLVNPLADVLQKKLKCPRGVSALLVIIFTIGIIGGTISVIVWKLIIEIKNLYEQFPQIYMEFQAFSQSFSQKWSKVYESMPVQIQTILTEISRDFSAKATAFINSRSEPVVDYASRFAKAIPGGFISVIIFILSVYFMVVDSEKVSVAVKKIIGRKLTVKLSAVKKECKKYLGGYVRAQFTIMCIAFVLMLTEFSIAGIKYALLISFMTAFTDALPVFGSGIVLWPLAVINFLSGNIKSAVVLVIAYISVVIMRHLTEPKLVSSKIGLNPLLTLMAMYIGYRIWGIPGIIFGTIILMGVVSFYKAGIFDAPIRWLKQTGKLIRVQYKSAKRFIKNIMEGKDE